MSALPVFSSLSDLRTENNERWLSHLAALSNGIITAWEIFKLQNRQNEDLIALTEIRFGPAPTRINMAEQGKYPIEESYYTAIADFYKRLYENFYERLSIREQGKRIAYLRRIHSMTLDEAEAVVMYLRNQKNTLLAVKVLNRFARAQSIRVEDAEIIFHEALADYFRHHVR